MLFKSAPLFLCLVCAAGCVGTMQDYSDIQVATGGQGGHEVAAGGSSAIAAGAGGTAQSGGAGGNTTVGTGGVSASGGTTINGGAGGSVPKGGSAGRASVGGMAGQAPTGGSSPSESWLVADDFESGNIDAGKWSAPSTELATIAVQDKVFAHGRNALRIAVQATTPNGGHNRHANISVKNVPADLKGNVFLRMYVRFAQAPAFKDVMFFAGTGGAEYGSSTAFGTYPLSATQGNWYGQIDNSVGGTSTPVTVGTWVCLEAQWQSNPSRVSVFADGKMVVTQPGPSAPDFSKITIGFGSGHAPEYDTEMFIDDLAMDTQRIGCL
jgi:hypothetical protein